MVPLYGGIPNEGFVLVRIHKFTTEVMSSLSFVKGHILPQQQMRPCFIFIENFTKYKSGWQNNMNSQTGAGQLKMAELLLTWIPAKAWPTPYSYFCHLGLVYRK